MKLKETTIDQRLFAGMLSLLVFFVGFLILGEIHSRAEQLCQGNFDQDLTILYVYLLLATVGCGLSVLHLLSMLKFRKSK